MIHVQEGKSSYIEILCMHVVRQASVIMYQLSIEYSPVMFCLYDACVVHCMCTVVVIQHMTKYQGCASLSTQRITQAKACMDIHVV